MTRKKYGKRTNIVPNISQRLYSACGLHRAFSKVAWFAHFSSSLKFFNPMRTVFRIAQRDRTAVHIAARQ